MGYTQYLAIQSCPCHYKKDASSQVELNEFILISHTIKTLNKNVRHQERHQERHGSLTFTKLLLHELSTP